MSGDPATRGAAHTQHTPKKTANRDYFDCAKRRLSSALDRFRDNGSRGGRRTLGPEAAGRGIIAAPPMTDSCQVTSDSAMLSITLDETHAKKTEGGIPGGAALFSADGTLLG